MDSIWRSENYTPSSASETSPYELLEPVQLQQQVSELQGLTKSIEDLPYDPETWLLRAQILRSLGYPDLSLGDAHKARLLIDARHENSALGAEVTLTVGLKLWMLFTIDPAYQKWSTLINEPGQLEDRVDAMFTQLELQIWAELLEGLLAANCCAEYLALSSEAVERFPEDAIFPSEAANAEAWMKQRIEILGEQELSAEKLEATLSYGSIYPTAYPWMEEAIIFRDVSIVEALKLEFKIASTCANVARSGIQDISATGAAEETSTLDVLGVIASRNIVKGETIIMDSTTAGVISATNRCPSCCVTIKKSSVNACCPVSYCSRICADIATSTYHLPICNKDFSFLLGVNESVTDSTDFRLDSILLLRILALSIQEAVSHPLQSSLIARLTPFYTESQPLPFSFQHHIVTPIATLLALDICPFSASQYETWVIQTLRYRTQNNKHGHYLDGNPGSAVSPLYSMFNHSCEPNVDWEHGRDADGQIDDGGESSTVRMFAERDVEAGEELFICYLKPRSMGLEERRERLGAWWEGECACNRCESESAEAKAVLVEE